MSTAEQAPRIRAAIAERVAAAPALSAAQRERLGGLLRPVVLRQAEARKAGAA